MAEALAKILLESKVATWRINAAWALEYWGTADSIPALKKAAADSNTMVQNRARKTLEKLTVK
jgi:HEAT repeat protein